MADLLDNVSIFDSYCFVLNHFSSIYLFFTCNYSFKVQFALLSGQVPFSMVANLSDNVVIS